MFMAWSRRLGLISRFALLCSTIHTNLPRGGYEQLATRGTIILIGIASRRAHRTRGCLRGAAAVGVMVELVMVAAALVVVASNKNSTFFHTTLRLARRPRSSGDEEAGQDRRHLPDKGTSNGR